MTSPGDKSIKNIKLIMKPKKKKKIKKIKRLTFNSITFNNQNLMSQQIKINS